ncbi:uncharacterized protein LOC117015697 [Rhinolophus ferrumequinum]|uniref:uncharacterized protein LOC117015697 n=1 Tax=Rhinolophus ferrumequinum TaxID=59479 RepID=UPI00140FD78E|nr:uncharacterized protein LOC117015697 [Rhinolophus ferrumequinum]
MATETLLSHTHSLESFPRPSRPHTIAAPAAHRLQPLWAHLDTHQPRLSCTPRSPTGTPLRSGLRRRLASPVLFPRNAHPGSARTPSFLRGSLQPPGKGLAEEAQRAGAGAGLAARSLCQEWPFSIEWDSQIPTPPRGSRTFTTHVQCTGSRPEPTGRQAQPHAIQTLSLEGWRDGNARQLAVSASEVAGTSGSRNRGNWIPNQPPPFDQHQETEERSKPPRLHTDRCSCLTEVGVSPLWPLC